MTYHINRCYLLFLRILLKIGRGGKLRKKIYSTENILKNNFKINSDFSFVQIGANDGISFDFLYSFVILRNSSGIVVEPVKEYFDELCENYKNNINIVKVNKAIHPTKKEMIIYKILPTAQSRYPEWVKGIASFDSTHHLKLKINSNDIVEEKVISDNLHNIISDNLKIFELDYFQIDTEGFDFEILKMIDFNILKTKMIKFESVNLLKGDAELAFRYLEEKGYHMFNESGDTIGVNLRKLRLL
jgi:FkbM family methyltransferase